MGKTCQFSAFLTFGKMLDFERLQYQNYLTHIKGYQWKDNVHIFHLMPSSILCDHWFGHRVALKIGPIL